METHYCINCGQEASELHHVVPLALGGNDIDSNKVWLCIKCHSLIHEKSLAMSSFARQSPNYKKALAEGRCHKPRKELPENFEDLYNQWRSGIIKGKKLYQDILHMSKSTFLRRIKEYESSLNNGD